MLNPNKAFLDSFSDTDVDDGGDDNGDGGDFEPSWNYLV